MIAISQSHLAGIDAMERYAQSLRIDITGRETKVGASLLAHDLLTLDRIGPTQQLLYQVEIGLG